MGVAMLAEVFAASFHLRIITLCSSYMAIESALVIRRFAVTDILLGISNWRIISASVDK